MLNQIISLVSVDLPPRNTTVSQQSRMGSCEPGTCHPRAAGRIADSIRNIDHRGRCHHHRSRGLLRDARHIMASVIREACRVVADTHTKRHRRVPGEDRGQDEPAHARLRGRWFRLRDSFRVHRLLRVPHRGGKRHASCDGGGASVLARRVLASVRHEARRVPAVSPRPPLRFDAIAVRISAAGWRADPSGPDPGQAEPQIEEEGKTKGGGEA